MTTKTSANSKQALLTRLGLMIGGLQTNPPTAAPTLALHGTPYTIAQIIALLEPMQGQLQAVASARAALAKAIATAAAQESAIRAMLGDLRGLLIQAYGPDLVGLAACGIVPKPRVKRTSEQSTIAAAKAAATRSVNGTGKKAAKPTHTVTVTDASGQVVGPKPPTGTPPAARNEPVPAPAAAIK
jgi:hypothetical protein